MSEPSLAAALWDAVVAIGELGAMAAVGTWDFLAEHPQARRALIMIAVVVGIPFSIYWFYDGVRNWRRKCFWCRGRGSFNSVLSKRLDRPCKCCGGGGRHTTIRKRIVQRVRS